MIYLAGPDVFLPDAVEIGREKVRICARYGLTGCYPLDNEIADPTSSNIFRGNTEMMDRCSAIIANLTPFRGPSADSGTVYELGYMAGSRKLCLGYSNDLRRYKQRVRADGMKIEDFGLSDNLMIEHGLETFGAPLVFPLTDPHDPWHDLSAFEACVRLAADMLAPARRSPGSLPRAATA